MKTIHRNTVLRVRITHKRFIYHDHFTNNYLFLRITHKQSISLQPFFFAFSFLFSPRGPFNQSFIRMVASNPLLLSAFSLIYSDLSHLWIIFALYTSHPSISLHYGVNSDSTCKSYVSYKLTLPLRSQPYLLGKVNFFSSEFFLGKPHNINFALAGCPITLYKCSSF